MTTVHEDHNNSLAELLNLDDRNTVDNIQQVKTMKNINKHFSINKV